jgi:hypothetical protein
MRDKKGFLLTSEVLKIIVAVVCIGFLVYFLVSLYFANLVDEKTRIAEGVLNGDNGIGKEIERLNAGGEPDVNGFHVQGPVGWHLFSFVGVDKPNSCLDSNCVCICSRTLINLFKNQVKKCDKNGACLPVSNLKEFSPIKISRGGIFVSINEVEEFIEIKRKE